MPYSDNDIADLANRVQEQIDADEKYSREAQERFEQKRQKHLRKVITDVVGATFGIEPPGTVDYLLSFFKTDEEAVKPSFRPLRAFLCHSSSDKQVVRILYQRLKDCKIDPWLDEENLLPGQVWEQEIRKAVRKADVVIICLSRNSVSKIGFVQREIRFALDAAEEQPEGLIFLIPLKLEECVVPERLKHLHWVNYNKEDGFLKLMLALKQRGDTFKEYLSPVIIPRKSPS